MTTSSDHPGEEHVPGGEDFVASPWGSDPSTLSDCEHLESVVAELALGSLTGAERSHALAHLDECQSCRQLVEELTAAADSLLLVAAEADPPAGFEVRLLERLRSQGGVVATPSPIPTATPSPIAITTARAGAARRFTTRARFALAAAAVAVAAAGVGLGFEVAPRATTPVSAIGPLRVASLEATSTSATAPARSVGEVVVTTGRPSWVLMSVDVHATGWVTCQVDVNGRMLPVGSFEVYDGKGTWAATLRQSGAAITSARLVNSSGQVLASADLHA